MSLLYDQKIVSHIQNCLNTGNVIIESIESYDNLIPGSYFKMGDVSISFNKSTIPQIPGYIATKYMEDNTSKIYMEEWNKLPVRTHLIPDMRKLKMDTDGNVPYKTFEYTDNNGVQMKALVRKLFEIEEMDADQPECIEYFEKYCDLIHLDQCYIIIKIIPAEDYGYNQKNKVNINKACIVQDYIPAITSTEIDPENQITSEPLF